MAYDGRLLRLAQERYEADRSAREADLAEQREQLYARRPRLREIQDQLRRTASRVMAAALRRGEDPLPEIQRLIGRSLRAAVDMEALGERTITIDCDVLQGDGGTRTASVTGGFVALALACRKLVEQGAVERKPIRGFAAGISAGIVDDTPMLDLQYSEDSRAQVDLNCVMDERGGIIELQGTGEGRAFTPEEQQALVHLCAKGCGELIALQKKALGVGE